MKRFYKSKNKTEKSKFVNPKKGINFPKQIYSYTSEWVTKAKERVSSIIAFEATKSDQHHDFSEKASTKETTTTTKTKSKTKTIWDTIPPTFTSSTTNVNKKESSEMFRKRLSAAWKEYEKYFQNITDKINWDINQDVIKEMIPLKDFSKAKQTMSNISEAVSPKNFDVQKLLSFKNMELPYEQLLDHGREVSDRKFLEQAYYCSKLSRITYFVTPDSVEQEISEILPNFELIESQLDKNCNLKWIAVRKKQHTDKNRHLSDLYIAFRGTKQLSDVLTDISLMPKQFNEQISFHSGILTQIENEYDRLSQFLEMNVDQHNVKDIALTGHSLGGGYAKVLYAHLLLQKQMEENNGLIQEPLFGIKNDRINAPNTSVFTFGAPLTLFAQQEIPDHLQQHDHNIHCFVNNTDIIPRALGNDFYHDLYTIGNQLSNNLDQIDFTKVTQNISASLDHITSKAKEFPSVMSKVRTYTKYSGVNSKYKEETEHVIKEEIKDKDKEDKTELKRSETMTVHTHEDIKDKETVDAELEVSHSNLDSKSDVVKSQQQKKEEEESRLGFNLQELSVKSHLFRPWGTFYLLHPSKAYPIAITEPTHKKILVTPYPHLWLGLMLWFQEHDSQTYYDRIYRAFNSVQDSTEKNKSL